MQLKGTNIDNIDCYTLSFQSKVCLFISKPDLSKLKLFSMKNQQSIIKNYPSVASFSNIKIKLDLNYLKEIISHKKINCILLTSYKEYIVLPYLFKKIVQSNQTLKIFATHIMHQMGKIYLNSFLQKTKQFDQFYLSANKQLSYQEESQLLDIFYQEFGLKYQTWNYIYTKQDMQQCLSYITKVNYGQICDIEGIKIQSYASGNSLGGAIWLLESILTKQKVLFVKQISFQNWRSFSPILIQNQKKVKGIHPDLKNVDFLIFANKNIVTSNKKDNQSVINLLKIILKNIQSNQNCQIVLEDQILILDLLNYMWVQMKEKFYQIFIEDREFSKIVNYANTYVQFLSTQYRNRIHQDPPQYPYQFYKLLKEKGFLYCGTMTQIAQKQKIPLKQLILRSTPFINFKVDYTSYLEGMQQKNAIWYFENHTFNEQDLKMFIKTVKPKKIVTYSKINQYLDDYNHENIGQTQYFHDYNFQHAHYNHYLSKRISSNLINRYEHVDGYIIAYPVDKQFLHLKTKWTQQLAIGLKNRYRNVLVVQQFQLRTPQSQIWIQDYKIFLRSKNVRQVKQILKILEQISKNLKLR